MNAFQQDSPPDNPAVIETWRVSLGASIFIVDVRDDGSWQPFALAPVRLGGWTLQALSVASPAGNVEAAVRAWAQQCEPYGRPPTIRRGPPRKPYGIPAHEHKLLAGSAQAPHRGSRRRSVETVGHAQGDEGPPPAVQTDMR